MFAATAAALLIGNSVLEAMAAMACGTPVISHRVGGATEILN